MRGFGEKVDIVGDVSFLFIFYLKNLPLGVGVMLRGGEGVWERGDVSFSFLFLSEKSSCGSEGYVDRK